MEESLVLVLGPPPDDWQKELFDNYQKSKNLGEPHEEGDWETYEGEVIADLFGHSHDAPSAIDELFSELLDAPVKVTDYFFSMGFNRGLWVANVTIDRSAVIGADGSSVDWPPTKEISDVVAASLGYALKRNWVGAFSGSSPA